MEVLMENLVERELISEDKIELKVESKFSLPENAKKVISVSCQLLEQNSTVSNNEIVFTGNFAMRLVFINEFEKFDSQDFKDSFEKKIVLKDVNNPSDVLVSSNLVDSQWQLHENQILLNNLIDVEVKNIKSHDAQIVSDLTGDDVEVRKSEHQVLTFNSVLNEKFEITENIELESACEGVLGVDVNPNLKDITASSGKVSLKGVLVVNLLGVKLVDNNSVPYNTLHEIDFSKSLNCNGITPEDLACGVVTVHSVEMHVENGQHGPVLALKLELLYHGCIYSSHKFNSVVDAISFEKELTLKTAQVDCVEVLPQVNTTVDIENNITLAPNSPYISHVLAVDSVRVNNLQASASDEKVLLDGVLAVNMLLENEEHIITGEHYDVPFQTHIRVDNLDRDYELNVKVVPLNVNAKARRGTELLLDAQLGVTVQSTTKKQITVVADLEEGAVKMDDGSAIRIYIVGEKENLWDLAKRTNLSCASLLQQNPNLENGCTAGERIVVYRHENVNL